MSRIAIVTALLSAASAACGAVDGDPDPPYPHPAGEVGWLDSTNDGVISLRHHDDGLSAQVRAGYGGDSLCLVVDWDLDTDTAHNARADQLVVAGGRRVVPGLRVLAGARLTGDLGGQAVQNAVHYALGDRRVIASYHGSAVLEPVGIVVAEMPQRPVYGRVVASVSPSCCQADAQVVADVCDGLRLEAGYVLSSVPRGPMAGDAAARLADAQRRGPHAGFSVQMWHLGWGIEYGDHETLGRVGIVF